jgi:ankyrin repeat protein
MPGVAEDNNKVLIVDTSVAGQHYRPAGPSSTLAPTKTFQYFSQLPEHLQSLILAYGQAPLDVCKASAVIPSDMELLSIWVGKTPYLGRAMLKAAERQQWARCSRLLSRLKHSQQAQSDTSVALMHAAAGGQVQLVQELIDKGARINPSWYYGYPVDHCLVGAAKNGHADVCSLLLKHGVCYSALLVAVEHAARLGQLAIMQVVLANPDALDILLRLKGGFAPALAAAAEGGHVELLKLIVAHGADVNHPSLSLPRWHDPSDSLRISLCLGSAIDNQHWAAVEFLLQAGANPGRDILLHAISSPDPTPACRVLLQFGIRDVGGQAAAKAAELGHTEAADLLADAFEQGSSSDDSHGGAAGEEEVEEEVEEEEEGEGEEQEWDEEQEGWEEGEEQEWDEDEDEDGDEEEQEEDERV